jgi:hypothetical protein
MREERVRREFEKRESRRAVGANVFGRKLTIAQAQRSHLDAAMLARPVDVDNLDDMQAADGSFYFQADYSAVDGPDPVQ